MVKENSAFIRTHTHTHTHTRRRRHRYGDIDLLIIVAREVRTYHPILLSTHFFSMVPLSRSDAKELKKTSEG